MQGGCSVAGVLLCIVTQSVRYISESHAFSDSSPLEGACSAHCVDRTLLALLPVVLWGAPGGAQWIAIMDCLAACLLLSLLMGAQHRSRIALHIYGDASCMCVVCG